MKTIKVWSCCGAFGWYCPWGAWMAGNPQLMPTYDAKERYVYLFSQKGQLGDARRAEMVSPQAQGLKDCIGIVGLDQFIHPERLEVDWNGVYQEIVRVSEAVKDHA